MYRVLGRLWQTFYIMSLLCAGIYLPLYNDLPSRLQPPTPGPGRLKRPPPTPHLGKGGASLCSLGLHAFGNPSHSAIPPHWIGFVWLGEYCATSPTFGPITSTFTPNRCRDVYSADCFPPFRSTSSALVSPPLRASKQTSCIWSWFLRWSPTRAAGRKLGSRDPWYLLGFFV